MKQLRLLVVNILAILSKELQGYFYSPLSYLIASIFWLIAGFFLVAILFGQGSTIQEVANRERMGIPIPPIDLSYVFLRDFLGVMGSLSLFILPMLSMGLYAEERKLGTLELLETSPISNLVIAMSKLLGVVIFFITLLIPLICYQIIVFSSATPPLPPSIPLLGHLGLILLATAILSLGMFISSTTDSSLLAAVFTFSLVLFLWVVDVIAANVGGIPGKILAHLSLLENYDNLVKGVFHSSSVVLFISYIILGVFLTTQSLKTLSLGRR